MVAPASVHAQSHPVRAKGGMVVSADLLGARVGMDALADGGNAIDAAVATAFALAVSLPAAGNLGGGGFLLYRPVAGDPVAYDFREIAPARADATMFLKDGAYDEDTHHQGHLAVGVPGTVAGLHMAWKDHGRLTWRRLVEPAIDLARHGFVVSDALARSLRDVLPLMRERGYDASVAQFSKPGGDPYEIGDVLKQLDLARTLERIAERGPDGFYRGETARLIEVEMKKHEGFITREDLEAYRPLRRTPIRGSYRGYAILGIPPVSSGGTAIVEALNILEGYDLTASGYGSAATTHVVVEALRRVFADRAHHLGDPAFNPEMPIATLISKEYAAGLRSTISPERATRSTPKSFEWPTTGEDTTHFSIIDEARNTVAMTCTLEYGYGSKIVVPGGGFLLNNEMGDFNAALGLTNEKGLIGTEPNLATPGRRMLSSMSPTIVEKDGQPFMAIGSSGGRAIISIVLLAIVNVVDFGMNIQEALDAPRFHHQWLPDRIVHERYGLSPDTRSLLEAKGHILHERESLGQAQGIVYDAEADLLEGGSDKRSPDGAALGR